MPEPVSIAVGCWLGYAALSACAQPRSAYSSAASDLSREVDFLMNATENSQFLFGRKAEAIALLRQIAVECADSDWDGNGANAMEQAVFQNAEAFIRALPEDMPMPELAPEPDGCVSLDWMAARQRVFSVSIGTDNRLAYAWMDGGERGHAVAVFDGLTIPSRIKDGITAITGNDHTAIRVA